MAKRFELTPDGIIRKFNSLKNAGELARNSNSSFYLACQVLMLIKEEGEMQMHHLREKICFGYQCFNRVLNGLVDGGALSFRDEGDRRDRDITFSGKHYSLTKEGGRAAEYVHGRIEFLSGYGEIFGSEDDDLDLED